MKNTWTKTETRAEERAAGRDVINHEQSTVLEAQLTNFGCWLNLSELEEIAPFDGVTFPLQRII